MKNRSWLDLTCFVLGAAALVTVLHGCRSGTSRRLANAVSSGDVGEISRAFHDATYDTFARMSISVPAMREYLMHPNPYVRYTAARYLYVAGDQTGYRVLLELVRAHDPVWVRYDVPREVIEAAGTDKEDLRVSAARVLGKYRQKDAAPAILALVAVAPDGQVVDALKKLGIRATPAGSTRFFATSAESYGIVGASEFIPDLILTLEHPHPPDLASYPNLRVATAWALAELTGERRYVEVVAEAAQRTIDRGPGLADDSAYDDSSKALEYMGSLHNPRAREVLESALGSQHPVAEQYAVVNLLFNQEGGSQMARQVVLRELRGKKHMLGADLLLNLAASLNDAETMTTAEMYNPAGLWFLYAIERRNWPIYNWIDDYVVKLNGIPKLARPERLFGERRDQRTMPAPLPIP